MESMCVQVLLIPFINLVYMQIFVKRYFVYIRYNVLVSLTHDNTVINKCGIIKDQSYFLCLYRNGFY